MCSSVLQDYVDKESRLLDLKTEKLELAQGTNRSSDAHRASVKSQRSGTSLTQEDEDASSAMDP